MKNPPSWKTVKRWHSDLSENECKGIAAEMKRVWEKTLDYRTVLHAYNRSMGFYGIEYLSDRKTGKRVVAYANTGETYQLTLLHHLETGAWSFNSWGNLVEHHPYKYE